MTSILCPERFHKKKAFIAFFSHSSQLKTIPKGYDDLETLKDLSILPPSPEQTNSTLEAHIFLRSSVLMSFSTFAAPTFCLVSKCFNNNL